jgi:hypothetical protein
VHNLAQEEVGPMRDFLHQSVPKRWSGNSIGLARTAFFTSLILSAYPHRHARNVIIPQANWSIAR